MRKFPLLLLFAALLPAAFAAAPRPNVVLIMSDDMGYSDLGCYGARDIRTPHIDRLAREGVRFTDFYANAPVCTPTPKPHPIWSQKPGKKLSGRLSAPGI